MTCSHMQSLLEDYLDGELSEATSLTVAAHLESCGSCRAELEASRRLGRTLRGYTAPEPPADYWSEVQGLIMARTVDHVPGIVTDADRRRREKNSLYQSLLAVAASLIVFFAALLAGAGGPSSSDQLARTDGSPLTKASLVAMACADPDSEACIQEQERLAQGLLLMGRTGLLGGSADLVATLGIK